MVQSNRVSYLLIRSYSHLTGVYNPKAFIPHAASLGQACAHCPKFPTAASRRSLGRVSVPMWPITLSGRLPIVALVSHYLTNKLIGRGPIQKRQVPKDPHLSPNQLASTGAHAVLTTVSLVRPKPHEAIPYFWVGYPRVTHPFAARVLPKEPYRSTCMC